MNNNCPCRTLPSGARKLVIPASVVKATSTGKQLRIVGRIVIHHQQNLAAQVGSFEIVPLVFGCLNAVAHEHNLGAVNRDFRLRIPAGEDVIVVPLERERLLTLPKRHRVGNACSNANQRH